MKSLLPDTIFLRLFLLLFVTLSASHFVGMEVFSSLRPMHAVDPEHVHPHPFQLWGFLMRLAGITLTAWIGARWLAHPIDQC
jgi:hypothetical protein